MDEVKNEAQRIAEDSINSAKSQFNAGARWLRVHYYLGLPAAVLAALASASAFNEYAQLAGAISIIVAALTAVVTFLDPNGKSVIHKASGDKYLKLRNSSRRFHNIEIDVLAESEILAKIQELSQQRDELNETSPMIPNWAFKKAKKGIDDGESTYKIDNMKDK